MSLHPNLVFLAGLVIILLGAEVLLRGAARIATLMGIRPIIIGLTVVSVGTSAPELAVGIAAARDGYGALAVGNIAGTNILNILFILGLSAWIKPLPIHNLSIKLDVPVMIATSVMLVFMSFDRMLTPREGYILVAASILYTAFLVRLSRKQSSTLKREYAEEYGAGTIAAHERQRKNWGLALNFIFLLGGIALTVLGANLMVDSAVVIARTYGVSEAIIGLTIVAIGSSAPELATTLVATLKGDRDVAIGNLIGSSIYNVLVILGITCIASGEAINISQDILWIDLPLAAGVAVVCYPVFKTDRLVTRKEGAAFVLAYLLYLGILVFVRA